MKKHLWSSFAMLLMVFLALGSTDTETRTASNPSIVSPVTVKKWYEGGTLHQKTALEWQSASSGDKLATCADFVTRMWQNGELKASIARKLSEVDDVRPLAQELVAFIDAAIKPDSNPKKNRKMAKLYSEMTVAELAVVGMHMMEWTN